MELFGFKFAPLNVPLERRLQTLAAAAWFYSFAFGGFFWLFLTLYVLIFTKYWWLVLPYLFWIWVIDLNRSHEGGRRSTWMRGWLWWKYFNEYFPASLEKVPGVELDPKRNYLFCIFPHGVLCCGACASFSSKYGNSHRLFPHHQTRQVTLAQNYHMPIYRELALGLGGIAPSYDSIDYVLRQSDGGYIVVLAVGGSQESYYCKPGKHEVIVKKRKGFVKLALKNGSPLVPVFTFGETDLYDQLDGPFLRSVQEKIRKKFGFAPLIPVGRGFFQYSFGLIPRRHPITTVVGRPVEVPKIESPTQEQIDDYHKKFMDALTELFEEYKYIYLQDPENKHLVIH